MFDIGWSELLVIAVVAVIVVGPRELPAMLRTFGQYVGKMKRMAGEFQSQFDQALKDAELDTLKKDVESLTKMDPIGDLEKDVTREIEPITRIGDDIRKSVETPSIAKSPAKAGAGPQDGEAAKGPGEAKPGVKAGGEAA